MTFRLKTCKHVKIIAIFKSHNVRSHKIGILLVAIQGNELLSSKRNHAVNQQLCDTQIDLHRQEIYTPQRLILCVMMYVMYNTAFQATDMASKLWTFLKANYMKNQVMAKLPNQVISKSVHISHKVITHLNPTLFGKLNFICLVKKRHLSFSWEHFLSFCHFSFSWEQLCSRWNHFWTLSKLTKRPRAVSNRIILKMWMPFQTHSTANRV